MTKLSVEQLEALLPQTQCGLCGYDGCRPYAKAMLEQQEKPNRCPPGGVQTLQALGAVLQRDIAPFIADMRQKQKPTQVVQIREAECIGCTKCIQACPVDAIVGSGKRMHTVIEVECSGCELCIEPCPVDCIDLVVQADASQTEKQARASVYQQRYWQRQARLSAAEAKQRADYQALREGVQAVDSQATIVDKQAFIQAARVRAKRNKERQGSEQA